MQHQIQRWLSDFFGAFSFFEIVILIFWLITLTIVVYILNNLSQISRRHKYADRWKFITDTAIRNAIFSENEPDELSSPVRIDIPKRLSKLLDNPFFRVNFTYELIKAKQNLSGSAVQNLKALFTQLNLHKFVLRMLNHRSWYMNAVGIQQVGEMDLVQFRDRILEFTKSKRRLIRIEAQNSLIKFDSIDGLRFLNDAEFPISDWQQIKLFEKISKWRSEDIRGIDVWLNSANPTVVIFALKLVRIHNKIELFDHVVRCLANSNEDVRKEAILTLAAFPSEETAKILISFYGDETERNRLILIKSLSGTVSEADIPFLKSLLASPANTVKIAAARSIASVQGGMEELLNHPLAAESPYSEIIQHIKSEMR